MATTESTTDSDSDVPITNYDQIDYSETSRKSYPNQQAVADAWAGGKYPSHNVGPQGAVLYTGTPDTDNHPYSRGRYSRSRGANSGVWSDSGARGTRCNFYGVQHDDGSGTLWHYNTREAIRTSDNTVILNQQCWSTGFAHCSHPEEWDFRVPFDAVEEHLDANDTVFDIEGVLGQPETSLRQTYDDTLQVYTRKRARGSVVIINGEDESYGIYVGRDASIINGPSSFTFTLSASEVADLDSATDALDLLTPEAVNQSDMEVVDSSEFTKTRLDESEREAHLNAGGNLSSSNSRWRDEKINRQHYRADLRGNVIVRQGEWFLIPTGMTEDDDVPEQGTQEAQKILDSHRASRFHGARQPLPSECPNCGASSIHVECAGDCSCIECGHWFDRPIFVRGMVRHTSNDHNAIGLGDEWHRAIQHSRDVLTYDPNPSTGGGGGWD